MSASGVLGHAFSRGGIGFGRWVMASCGHDGDVDDCYLKHI